MYRYKTLLGTSESPSPGATMGILELHPGTYPSHAHAAPEIYYILRGEAEWTVGDETFEAREGTAIYHAPGERHRMVNRDTKPLVAVWFWWAPEGRTSVLDEPSKLSPRSTKPKTRRRER